MQKSRDAKRYVARHGGSDRSDRYFGNILQTTRSLYDFRFKSYGLNSGFNVFDDLDIDL